MFHSNNLSYTFEGLCSVWNVLIAGLFCITGIFTKFSSIILRKRLVLYASKPFVKPLLHSPDFSLIHSESCCRVKKNQFQKVSYN